MRGIVHERSEEAVRVVDGTARRRPGGGDADSAVVAIADPHLDVDPVELVLGEGSALREGNRGNSAARTGEVLLHVDRRRSRVGHSRALNGRAIGPVQIGDVLRELEGDSRIDQVALARPAKSPSPDLALLLAECSVLRIVVQRRPTEDFPPSAAARSHSARAHSDAHDWDLHLSDCERGVVGGAELVGDRGARAVGEGVAHHYGRAVRPLSEDLALELEGRSGLSKPDVGSALLHVSHAVRGV